MDNQYPFNPNTGAFSILFRESGCLTDVGFAVFMAGSVSEDEKRALEKHMAQCNDCRLMLADLIRTVPEPPSEEQKRFYAPSSAEINRYTEIIKSRPENPTFIEHVHSLLSNVRRGLASPRFAYGLAAVLLLILAGTLIWMRSVPKRYEVLYAQAMESLKPVSRFETASGLRFVAPLIQRDAEIHLEGEVGVNAKALDAALSLFHQALGSNPRGIGARIALGQIYLVKREPEEASKNFEAAINLDKSNQEAINGLGIALYESAMLEREPYKRETLLRASSDAFDKILTANPQRLETVYNQALVCYALGEKSKTLNLVEIYLAQDSTSRWAKQLSSIRDQLRLNSHENFKKEIEEVFQKREFNRLAEMVSSSPYVNWLIKKSLSESLKSEVEGDFERARQGFEIAETVERAYRQSTGDENYLRLIEFYKRLTYGEKQQEYRASSILDETFKHYQSGNLKEALNLSTKTLAIYQRLDDHWATAYVHHLIGNCFFYGHSNYGRALEAYRAMAAEAERGGDYDELAQALANISVIYQDQGNYDVMKTSLDRVLVLADKLRNTVYRAFALNHLGNLYREVGDLEQSMVYYTKGLIASREIGDRVSELQNLEHISFLYQRKKEYNKSAGFL